MTEATPRRAGLVGVVGAGTMGAGIAQVAAGAGFDVVLYSRTEATLGRAADEISWSLERLARRSAALVPARVRDRIRFSTELDALAEADVVVESVPENLDLKRQVFAEAERHCSDRTLLASNTSGIPISRIAAVLKRPARAVGMHFCAPVPVMELCEVVRGERTSEESVDRALAFAEDIGKRAVLIRNDAVGAITTRLIAVLALEAIRMVEDGTSTIEEIDLACRLGLGHAMGPLASADLSGLDVFEDVTRNLHDLTGNPTFVTPPILRQLVADGHHGRKSGRGFHHYPQATRSVAEGSRG